jgi:hypothetical protein
MSSTQRAVFELENALEGFVGNHEFEVHARSTDASIRALAAAKLQTAAPRVYKAYGAVQDAMDDKLLRALRCVCMSFCHSMRLRDAAAGVSVDRGRRGDVPRCPAAWMLPPSRSGEGVQRAAAQEGGI